MSIERVVYDVDDCRWSEVRSVGEFGFEAQKGSEWDQDQADLWHVRLPHQCDWWDIAGGDYGPSVPLPEAIDRLTLFINEATELLDALKAEDAQLLGGDA